MLKPQPPDVSRRRSGRRQALGKTFGSLPSAINALGFRFAVFAVSAVD
jgi:hypothetical protein